MPRKVEISHRTIIFTLFLLGGLALVYYIRDIILELFVALLLMAILNPMVGRFVKFKIPRALAVFLTYFIVIGLFGGAVALIIPPLVEQTGSFVSALSFHSGNFGMSSYINSQILGNLFSTLGDVPGQLFKFTFSLVNNLVVVITVLVFTFYFLLGREKLVDQLGFLIGEEKRHFLTSFIDALERRLGGWARGQLILMVSVGVATYIGLLVIGVPFALPLAILAGVFEIIPYLGPLISAIPSVIIGFGISPVTGVGVAAMIFLIQQLENHILVPKIMGKSIGVSPLVILISLAVGARLAGLAGVIISIPVVIVLQVLAELLFSEGGKPDSVLRRSSV